MFYDKKIKYLNYIVDGERIKGCGFVKVEMRDLILNLEVVVSGLPPSTNCITEVWLCAGVDSYPLGKICLENGRGDFHLCNCNFKEICPTGITYEDWSGIFIFPQEGWEVSGTWGQPCSCVLERVEVSTELVGEVKAELNPEISERSVDVLAGVGTEKLAKVKEATDCVERARSCPNSQVQAEGRIRQISGIPAESKQQENQVLREDNMRQIRLAEDKWEQLSGIYPHIRPFRDKREYLSIRPADFVLLSAESYKAVNNSFLLHGFYNYQHLILARAVKKGEVSYYVGTPGNFFEREKQVAIMFGFTGFECTKDPAREGDFGYYLMEVQL